MPAGAIDGLCTNARGHNGQVLMVLHHILPLLKPRPLQQQDLIKRLLNSFGNSR